MSHAKFIRACYRFYILCQTPPTPLCVNANLLAPTDSDCGRGRKSADRQRLGVDAALRGQRCGGTASGSDELRKNETATSIRTQQSKQAQGAGKAGDVYGGVAGLFVSFFPTFSLLRPPPLWGTRGLCLDARRPEKRSDSFTTGEKED